jgi:hypothetical protein
LANKAIVLFLLLFIPLLVSVAVATAQDSASSLIAVSSTEISFYGEEGSLPTSQNITLVGLADGVEVKLVPSNLYLNGLGEGIPVKLDKVAPLSTYSFTLSKNQEQIVEVALVSAGKPGIYKGSIIVTTKIGNENATTTNLTVVATFESGKLWIFKMPWSEVIRWTIVGTILLIVSIGLAFPEEKENTYFGRKILSSEIKGGKRVLEKKYLVTMFGIVVSLLWLVLLVYFDFGAPSTVFAGLMVVPFVTYAVSIIKDRRTERLEKEKISRTIRDQGIQKDLELIVKLIGDMATHCASFNPNFYEEKLNQPSEGDPKILYHKTGLLETKVWSESCRQGYVADIHTLHLEKYYDFIPFYNQCYAHAMKLFEEKDKEQQENKPEQQQENKPDGFLKAFENFRKTYGDLQRVLFVYLSYVLDLYSKTTLAPMKFEFPRITRTLLYKLIGYGILNPFDFINRLNGFRIEDLAREFKEELVFNLGDLEKGREKASEKDKQGFDELIDPMKKLGEKLKQLQKQGPDEGVQARFGRLGEKARRSMARLSDDLKPSGRGPKLENELRDESRKEVSLKFRNELISVFKERKENPDLKTDVESFVIWFRKYVGEKKTPLKDEFKKAKPELDENAEKFKVEFEKYAKKKMLSSDSEVWETAESWVTMKFKQKIEWWRLTADDLEKIVNFIYAEDEIPHFFRHMQDDFQETYLKLKKDVRDLSNFTIPPMPKDSDVKEYKIALGNVYKKVEDGKKSEKELPEPEKERLEPDPLRIDLNASAHLDSNEKPTGSDSKGEVAG